jgi:hypothetical protein
MSTISRRSLFTSLALALPLLAAVGTAEAGGKRCKRRCAPPPCCIQPGCPVNRTCHAVTSNPLYPIVVNDGDFICLSFRNNVANNIDTLNIQFTSGTNQVGYLEVSSYTTGFPFQVYGWVRYTPVPKWGGLADIKLTVTYTGGSPIALAPVYPNSIYLN